MSKNKKEPTKRKLLPRPYNDGTMTQSGFFGMIRSSLRQSSRWWKPILAVKNDAKVPYKGPNKRQKYAYICNNCKKSFSSKEVNVHHIIPCGTLSSFDDLPNFARNLFCEKEGLVLLCNTCHDRLHTKIINE